MVAATAGEESNGLAGDSTISPGASGIRPVWLAALTIGVDGGGRREAAEDAARNGEVAIRHAGGEVERLRVAAAAAVAEDQRPQAARS